MKRILLATAILGVSATALMAAGPKADLNADGQVTLAEFTSIASQNFTQADLNGDNFLSEDEVKGLHEARRDAREDARFERADLNGDGAITRDEVDAAKDAKREKRTERREEKKAEMLERYDTNVDGELSEAERDVAKAERKAERGERKAERGEKREDRKRDGKRAKRPTPDADGDGFVSRAEHMAVTEQLFARMDANGDGVLTQGEGGKRKGRKGKRRGR